MMFPFFKGFIKFTNRTCMLCGILKILGTFKQKIKNVKILNVVVYQSFTGIDFIGS